MRKKISRFSTLNFLQLTVVFLAFFFAERACASPIISGISTNEINIDTKFRGADILLFGAKGYSGNIIIAVRGPKKNYVMTKKERFLGVWHNGKRVKVKDSYSYYALFSTFNQNVVSPELLSLLELGRNNLNFNFSDTITDSVKDEFKVKFVDKFEKEKLYPPNSKIDFLDETLFKVMLHFPKNIARGIYTVEIYLINEDNLTSFQSIPIYVNQVGFSARVLDFAYQQSFLYGLIAVCLALFVGWITNYLFIRFFGK